MADNLVLNPGADGSTLATAEVTFSGDIADVQIIGAGLVSGSAESYVVALASAGAGAVGTGVQRVTLASDDPAVVDLAAIEVLITSSNALLTTIDADTDAIKTAVELIDDTVAVLGTATYSEATTKGNVVGAVRNDTLAALADTDNEIAPLQVDDLGGLYVSTKSIQDTNNTTTAPLGIDAVFTGASTNTLHYKTITIIIFADVASAADGVSLQWSGDGTNWNHTAEYTYAANMDLSIGASVRGNFFRLVFTNGGTGQAAFRAFTYMHPTEASHNIRPLEFTLTGQESAEMTRSILAAMKPDTTYTNIGSTAGGNLKVAVEEFDASLAVTNAGTFAVQENGAALTALQLLDNTVAVLGTATYSEASTSGNVVGAVRNDDLATLADTDNEIAPLQVDNQGALYTNAAAAENKQDSGVAVGGAPGTDDMIAAVAAKKILVTAMSLTSTSTTTNSVFVDNADNDLWANTANPIPLSMDADGDTVAGIVLPYNPAGWFKTDTVNEAVTLNSSAAQDIAWSISWIETD